MVPTYLPCGRVGGTRQSEAAVSHLSIHVRADLSTRLAQDRAPNLPMWKAREAPTQSSGGHVVALLRMLSVVVRTSYARGSGWEAWPSVPEKLAGATAVTAREQSAGVEGTRRYEG